MRSKLTGQLKVLLSEVSFWDSAVIVMAALTVAFVCYCIMTRRDRKGDDYAAGEDH